MISVVVLWFAIYLLFQESHGLVAFILFRVAGVRAITSTTAQQKNGMSSSQTEGRYLKNNFESSADHDISSQSMGKSRRAFPTSYPLDTHTGVVRRIGRSMSSYLIPAREKDRPLYILPYILP